MPVVFHLATSAHSSHPNSRKKPEMRHRPWPASPKADATPALNTSCKPSANHPEKNPAAPSNLSLRNESPAPPLPAPPSSSRIHQSREYARDSKQIGSLCPRVSTPD